MTVSTRPDGLIRSIRSAVFCVAHKEGLHWRRDYAFRSRFENCGILVTREAVSETSAERIAPTMGGIPVSEECIEDQHGVEGWAVLMSGDEPLVKIKIVEMDVEEGGVKCRASAQTTK